MANDGWFKCDKCGEEKKALVPDWTVKLQDSCSCGGTFQKK